jgi:hypothetical protein
MDFDMDFGFFFRTGKDFFSKKFQKPRKTFLPIPSKFVAIRLPLEYWRRRASLSTCEMDDWLEKSDTVESMSLQLFSACAGATFF